MRIITPLAFDHQDIGLKVRISNPALLAMEFRIEAYATIISFLSNNFSSAAIVPD